jgi:hypothetical protein
MTVTQKCLSCDAMNRVEVAQLKGTGGTNVGSFRCGRCDWVTLLNEFRIKNAPTPPPLTAQGELVTWSDPVWLVVNTR